MKNLESASDAEKKYQKEKSWGEIAAHIEKIIDKLGKHIDSGVKEHKFFEEK